MQRVTVTCPPACGYANASCQTQLWSTLPSGDHLPNIKHLHMSTRHNPSNCPPAAHRLWGWHRKGWFLQPYPTAPNPSGSGAEGGKEQLAVSSCLGSGREGPGQSCKRHGSTPSATPPRYCSCGSLVLAPSIHQDVLIYCV